MLIVSQINFRLGEGALRGSTDFCASTLFLPPGPWQLLAALNNRVSYLSVFDSLASFLRYFSFSDMQITHI